VNENSKSYSLVTRWGRNGQNGRQRSYTYDSAELSVEHFEKTFTEKTGLEWNTKNKKTKGRGYSCSRSSHGQVKGTTIGGTRNQTYKDDGTGKIRFSSPSKSKSGNFSDDNPFQSGLPPKSSKRQLEGSDSDHFDTPCPTPARKRSAS
jgi:predicted DNA-binding WGR domain protein